jgi:outer membrane protein TolC
MRRNLSYLFFSIFLLIGSPTLSAQETIEQLSLTEYLGYVKAFHPFVKQANIALDESEALLMKARGAFDPKFGLDLSEKTFKNATYYDRMNATFEVPTYYGVTVKGGYSEAEGNFLNPENEVIGEGLYSLGAELNLAKGLLANERMTVLKQAKLFTQQAEEDNALRVNEILFEAIKAYLDWYRSYQEYEVFQQFVDNARFRFNGVKARFSTGDLAAIDTTEARIAYNTRVLSLEKAQLKLREKGLKAANFIWVNDVPVQLNARVTPFVDESSYGIRFTAQELSMENHPKLKALGYKVDSQRLERRLQRSNLLPEVTLGYQWLSETDVTQNVRLGLDPENSTAKLKVGVPLFMRKERAELEIASLQLQEVSLEQERVFLELSNKIEALRAAVNSFYKQLALAEIMVEDFTTLFEGERQKFAAGESSLFLVNTRESNLIEGLLKAIELNIAEKVALSELYFNTTFNYYSIR